MSSPPSTIGNPAGRGASGHQSERVAFGRLWWVGLLVVVATVAANAIVRIIAVSLFDISPGFQPLAWGQFIAIDVTLVVGAVIVFAGVGRFARRPIRTFTWISVVVLVLSWLPDFGLLAAGERLPFPGANIQSVGTLMFMHVVAAVITVGLLTTLGREK